MFTSIKNERWREIRRTWIGLYFMIAGIILGVFPVLEVIGSFALFVGACLMFLGRGAFGPRHSIFVAASWPMLLVGFVGALIIGLPTDFLLFGDYNPNLSSFPSLLGLSDPILLVVLPLASILTGIALTLSILQIQSDSGVTLLLTGLLGIVAFSTMSVQAIIASAWRTGGATVGLVQSVGAWRFTDALFALLIALSYYSLLSQFERGDISERYGFTKGTP